MPSVVAALIWHDNTPARVARERLDLGTMHLRERRLGIVLDAVHEPGTGVSRAVTSVPGSTSSAVTPR